MTLRLRLIRCLQISSRASILMVMLILLASFLVLYGGYDIENVKSLMSVCTLLIMVAVVATIVGFIFDWKDTERTFGIPHSIEEIKERFSSEKGSYACFRGADWVDENTVKLRFSTHFEGFGRDSDIKVKFQPFGNKTILNCKVEKRKLKILQILLIGFYSLASLVASIRMIEMIQSDLRNDLHEYVVTVLTWLVLTLITTLFRSSNAWGWMKCKKFLVKKFNAVDTIKGNCPDDIF